MKLGKVLTYKDIDEAEKLVGKKVVASDVYASICDRPVILTGVVEGLPFPFRVSNGTVYQFIREVIEDEPEKPHYEPYDLSNPKVRDSLRGRWYKWEGPDGTGEEMVTRFLLSPCTKKWEINGWDGEWFLKHCHWLDDGTPCGRLMNMEVR